MLQLPQLRQDPTLAAERLVAKGIADAAERIQRILSLDDMRRATLQALEQDRAGMNSLAKLIGQEMAKGNQKQADDYKQQTSGLKQSISETETYLRELDAQLQEALVVLPNFPHPSVPVGRTPADNAEVFRNERQADLSATKQEPHWDIAARLGIIDFERGVKITGAGFPVYVGQGAILQRAIITWCLNKAAQQGYLEVQVPIVVNKESGFGTGQLPDKEGQMYHVTVDDFYLVPTAEVPITNLYRDEIIEPAALPLRRVGYTPCFRREAGSYGKDVRGLNRLHQFDKVEIVQVVPAEQSYDTLEAMRTYVGSLLEALELPYRTLLLCTGDMTFSSAKTYDLEVWSAAQERWLEVSSVSNFEAFQANRLKLRTRNPDGKGTQLLHTLNGSALALPRIVAALLENHQQPDGRIKVPQVLVPYTGFEYIG